MRKEPRTPKRGEAEPKGKITLYVDAKVAALYYEGQKHGWDLASLCSRSVSRIVRSRENTIRTDLRRKKKEA